VSDCFKLRLINQLSIVVNSIELSLPSLKFCQRGSWAISDFG